MRATPRTGTLRGVALFGLLFTLSAIAAIELVCRMVLQISTLTPLLAVVAYASFKGGLYAGLSSAALLTLYAVYYFSTPGQLFHYTHDGLVRLVIMPATSTIVVVIVASLRRAAQVSEAQLRRQLEFRRAIDNSLGEGVYALDREGRVTFVNPAAQHMLGWTEAALLGKNMHDTIHFQRADGTPYPREACGGLDVLRSGAIYHTDDEVFTRKDGTRFQVAYSSAPIVVDGRVEGAVVAFRDVTRRKQDERRLATQYAVSRVLADSPNLDQAAPQILQAIGACLEWDYGALWTVDWDRQVLRCVRSWHAPSREFRKLEAENRRITFARGQGLPGRAWASGRPLWIVDAAQETNFPRLAIAAAEGLHGGFGLPILIGHNVIGVCEFFSHEARPADQALLEMMAALGGQIGQFIERQRVEEAVRASEARKSAMLESALDAIITIDATGKILEFNPAAEHTFGVTRAGAVGREMAEVIVPPPLRDRHRRGLARYLATGEGPVLNQRVELTGLRADGVEFPIELTVTRIAKDGPPEFTGYIRDITDRKQAEEELHARARQQAAVADLGQRALALPDLARVADEAVALVARTLDVEYCTVLELLPDGRALLLRAGVGWREGYVGCATVGAGAGSQAGYTLQAQGAVVVQDLRTETRFQGPPLLHEHGVVSGMSVVIHGRDRPFGVLGAYTTRRRAFAEDDVHFLQVVANVLTAAIQRKTFEQQLAQERTQAERLAELDRLRREFISSVSHDLRTPLTAARAGLGLLETSAQDRLRTEERHLAGTVRRNIQRLSLLIDDLLAYNQLDAGTLRLDRRPLDLRTVVADATAAVQPLLQEKGQTLEVDLPEPLPGEGDPWRLGQVAINLLANAHEHTPPGTRIRVSSRLANGEVVLSVRDNGPGIPAGDLEAVFRPFHRIDTGGPGSGLGLAIARGIVELHGGRLWAESAPGEGAAFHLALPRHNGHTRRVECAGDPGDARDTRHRGRIARVGEERP